eukprot:10149103-Alexandrium_andersonii.AAC.1
MSSVFASGISCSPLSDIWSSIPSTRASDAAGPPPVDTGSDRASGSSCPGREPLEAVSYTHLRAHETSAHL